MYMNGKNVQVLWSLCLQLTFSCVLMNITYTSRDVYVYHVLYIFYLSRISAKICCIRTKLTLPLLNYIIAEHRLLSNLISKDAFCFCASNHCNSICLDRHTSWNCRFGFILQLSHHPFPILYFILWTADIQMTMLGNR